MKKVISSILKDDLYFNRKRPLLTFSAERIEGEVKYGDTLQGSFKIIADKSYQPEGYIYSSDLRMSVSRQEFGGLVMEVFYQYDARGLEEGSIMEGSFSIVSNLGEYELPYRIMVESEVPDSSMGEIKNLFHFTNLAKSNWHEAVHLFYSDEFEELLKISDEDYVPIYRSLAESGESEQNVENFLVLAKKKTRISYSSDVSKVEMDTPEESTWLSCCIVREGWGYSNVKIRSEGDFISLDTTNITTEDFKKNVFELNYCIDRELLYRGDNKGKIIVEDRYNHIEIPIIVHCQSSFVNAVSSERKHKKELMELYIDFRLGRINKQKWTRESMIIVNRMIHSNSDDLVARLYQTQVMIMEGRIQEAEQILDRLGMMISTASKEDATYNVVSKPEIAGYYYYLTSLCGKEEFEVRELAEKVEWLFAKNTDNWRLAWMLLYMRPDYVDNDNKKWLFIKKQYEVGMGSPVMFIEALQTMLRSPSVMTELSDFELAFLRFARRYNVFTRELRSRFVFLVPKMKAFSQEIYELLAECYQQEQRDETLQEICTLLMKGNKIGGEYFKWYALGVEQELRITRLYEYYIMSIDLNYEGKLPKMVLMYFAYRSNLDYERNAFLYANILKHKLDYKDTYTEYLPLIEEFAKQQLLKGHINDNLAYIYEHVARPLLDQEEYASAYLELCFMAKIHTEQADMTNVVVANKLLREDVIYPIYQGDAYVYLVGENNVIGLEDENGELYFDESLYTVDYVLRHRDNIDHVLPYAELNLRSALYRAQCYGGKMNVNADNEEALLWLSKQEEITEEFRLDLMLVLLEYYFEEDEIASLDSLLERFHPAQLNGQQRETCIHIMVARGKYDEAMNWLRTYGTEYINYKILLRLCDRILMRSDYEYESEVLKICVDIFQQGKYDETVLNYLLKYANGSSRFYKDLWRAADSFELNVHGLLEKMLIQILYSGEKIGEEANIYLTYVEYGAKPDVEKAALALLAYKYFNKQEKIDDKVFDRVIYLTQMGEDVPIGCKLAYLKKTTEVMKRGRLFDAEKALIPEFLKDMAARQIFFPFFMDFKHLAPELEMMSDRCFIEYHGTEGSKVVLHYVTELDNDAKREYKKEEMPHMYAGIYVKSFILFYGEKIQYYITEEDGRQEKLTQSSVLERGEDIKDNTDDRFSMINSLVISREMQDYATYCKVASEYAKKSFLVQRLFIPE